MSLPDIHRSVMTATFRTQRRESPSSSASTPATNRIWKLLSHTGHVTSIRELPHHHATMSIIRCRVPRTQTQAHVLFSPYKDQKARQMTSPNNVRTQRQCHGRCSPLVTTRKKHSFSPMTKSRQYGRTLYRLCAQSFRKYRLKLVTVFLRYYRSVQEKRNEEVTCSAQCNAHKEKEGVPIGILPPKARDSDFCESEPETEDTHHPVLQWSPSENDHIFVSHCEEDSHLAQSLVSIIESRGLSCRLLGRDFGAGPVVSLTEHAVGSSRRVVILLSNNYLQTQWFELLLSVWEMYHSQRALLVPVNVNVPEEKVPQCLAAVSLVDMRLDPNYQEKLVSILKGPEIPVRELMPAGNVSHGLAWAYYLRYLTIILPGLKERIDSWCTKEQCLDVRMPRKLYILVPASCYCPEKLTCAERRISFCGRLDSLRKNSAGSMGRSYDLSVWNLQKKDGEILQFVGEYAAIVDTLYKMENQRNAGLDSQLLKQQRDHFVDILKNILEADGLKRWAKLVFFQDKDGERSVVPLSDILINCVERDRLAQHQPATQSPHRDD